MFCFLELHVFGAIIFLFAKKKKILTDQGRDSLYFQVFPWLYFMRGHSLVELTEHDYSAADIILHRILSYTYI